MYIIDGKSCPGQTIKHKGKFQMETKSMQYFWGCWSTLTNTYLHTSSKCFTVFIHTNMKSNASSSPHTNPHTHKLVTWTNIIETPDTEIKGYRRAKCCSVPSHFTLSVAPSPLSSLSNTLHSHWTGTSTKQDNHRYTVHLQWQLTKSHRIRNTVLHLHYLRRWAWSVLHVRDWGKMMSAYTPEHFPQYMQHIDQQTTGCLYFLRTTNYQYILVSIFQNTEYSYFSSLSNIIYNTKNLKQDD